MNILMLLKEIVQKNLLLLQGLWMVVRHITYVKALLVKKYNAFSHETHNALQCTPRIFTD